jgi:hypothetical protein
MSTTPVIAPEIPEASGPINHFGRLIGVFFSPSQPLRTFKASQLDPLLILMTVLGFAVAFVMNQKVNWRDVASKRIEENPRAANLAPNKKKSNWP